MGLPIREDDFVASVSDALQFISCYHPSDYIAALHEAYLLVQMLGATGILGTIGKAERGPGAVDAIRRRKAVYLIAVGGAAYLVSKAIRNARVAAFADLGMEAIHEFEVEHMPVTVAVDSTGASVHQSGPADWRGRIAEAKLYRRVQG